MTSREETAACLRALRALRGWNQRQAAAAARLPLTRLSDYESGKISPTLERLEAIVAGLGYPMLSFEIARQLVRTLGAGEASARQAPPPGERPTSTGPALEVHGQVREIAGTGLALGVLVLPRGGARAARSRTYRTRTRRVRKPRTYPHTGT